jgi:hypothetical protein
VDNGDPPFEPFGSIIEIKVDANANVYVLDRFDSGSFRFRVGKDVTHPAGECTIDAEWMARVRELYVAGLHRAEKVAATRCGCGECEQHGHTSLGQCLTSSHAFGCEFAMRHLEETVGKDPHGVNRDRP